MQVGVSLAASMASFTWTEQSGYSRASVPSIGALNLL